MKTEDCESGNKFSSDGFSQKMTKDMEKLVIREVKSEDAAALLEIYAPYVTDTAVTFEYEVPSVAEFARRISEVSAKYPYLVAEIDGKPVAYAYAHQFQSRAAYQWAVESSIYVGKECRRCGIGRRLYGALRKRLQRQGILNMNACIAYPLGQDDPYLTLDSVRFHERMGFAEVAHFHKCGKKFDRWYDMIWMELLIGEHK